MSKNEIIHRLEKYEQRNHSPVRYSTEVTRIEPEPGTQRYLTHTADSTIESRNVVLATGLMQKVKIPGYAAQINPQLLQVTADQYCNPQSLPPGAVLVVGSAQSGCQIAEELHEAGRNVFLATGTCGRVPRRYRGRDIVEWLKLAGFFNRTAAALASPRDRLSANPQATGKGGGHDINLHKFCRDGITLLGHAVSADGDSMAFAADLKKNLSTADEFAVNALKKVDELIAKNGYDAPEEELRVLDDGYRAREILSLDLKAEGISCIVWACGFKFDYSMVQLPLLDEFGYPKTSRGITDHPGLSFLGIPFMDKAMTGLFMGIGESAAYLAEKITARQRL